MPIELFTGLPGNGKTALAMERLVAEATKAQRPIFAAGIDGLEPGFATVLDDPRDWNARDANGQHIVPDGSLIFVDEAWKWFGHLHDATRQATPKHVLSLAEHRHRGIDFVWTTQQPNQIYPFARGLIATHNHVVRRFGTAMIDVFTWQELNEDVKSASKREMAQRATRSLPKDVFGKYKSAEVHTIKARLPFRLLVLPAVLLAAGVAAWFAYDLLRPNANAERLNETGTDVAQAASAPDGESSHVGARKGKSWETVDAYVADHQPRIASLPWSAPAYDGRGVTADPMVYCMAAGAGQDADGTQRAASCTCTTEQGTPYALDAKTCAMAARQGPAYNPYRERNEERRGDRPVDRKEVRSNVATAGTVIAGEQVTAYGDLGQRKTVSAGI